MYTLEFLNANPNHESDIAGRTLFQKILTTPNSAEYIRLCIENGAECYAVRFEKLHIIFIISYDGL